MRSVDVADDDTRFALGGDDIDESQLEQVPSAASADDADTLDGTDSGGFLGANATAANAEQLDGRDSSEFVQGAGRYFVNGGVKAEQTVGSILAVPGFGDIMLGCNEFNQSTHTHVLYFDPSFDAVYRAWILFPQGTGLNTVDRVFASEWPANGNASIGGHNTQTAASGLGQYYTYTIVKGEGQAMVARAYLALQGDDSCSYAVEATVSP